MLNSNVFIKLTAILLAFIFMIGNQLLNAKSLSDEAPSIPKLVLDEEKGLIVPKRFRTTDNSFRESPSPFPSRQGLDSLHIAGSAQFSKSTLEKVIKELKGPIWIIDLRKESHGFVNDIPISWYSSGNLSNIDESDDNIQRQEEMLFNDIKHQGSILISQILEKKHGNITKTRPIDLKIESTKTESSLIDNMNLGYLRIGVLDHHRPTDAAVDTFLDFAKDVPPDAWLYFHCRGGAGRTTTFMVMYDIMKNGNNVSLNDIVERQFLLGGKNLFEIPNNSDDAWKKQWAIERKQFIEKFYQFVHDPRGFNHRTWSQWAASN